MRKIDKIIGGTLCTFLTHLSVSRREPSGEHNYSTILVVKLHGLGALVTIAPIFKALRERYPNAQICLLTTQRNTEIADLLKLTENRILCNIDQGLLSVGASLIRMFLEARRFRPDLVIDLEYFVHLTELIAFWSGSPVRIGYNSVTHPNNRLHNVTVPLNPDIHARDNFWNLAIAAGIKGSWTPYMEKPSISSYTMDRLRDKLVREMIQEKDALVLVNPNCSDLAPNRKWPPRYFVELIDQLTKADLKVALIGTRRERDWMNSEIISRVRKKTVNLAGELTLRELIALFRRAQLLITNDTGPLHLADLLEVPMICFFGPDTPKRWKPLFSQSKIFYADLPCSPCTKGENYKKIGCEGEPACLRAIEPPAVLEGCIALLAERR